MTLQEYIATILDMPDACMDKQVVMEGFSDYAPDLRRSGIFVCHDAMDVTGEENLVIISITSDQESSDNLEELLVRDGQMEFDQCPLIGKCAVCLEAQYHTTSGPVCKNSHGGTDTIDPVEPAYSECLRAVYAFRKAHKNYIDHLIT